MPPGVVTVTATAPALLVAGAVAVICVSETTVKFVAAVEPKLTAVAPVNPTPEMVTKLPPDSEPEIGDKFETVGGRLPAKIPNEDAPIAPVARQAETAGQLTRNIAIGPDKPAGDGT